MARMMVLPVETSRERVLQAQGIASVEILMWELGYVFESSKEPRMNGSG